MEDFILFHAVAIGRRHIKKKIVVAQDCSRHEQRQVIRVVTKSVFLSGSFGRIKIHLNDEKPRAPPSSELTVLFGQVSFPSSIIIK